jgi:uncharacterized RDD family membrane protein YckC
VRTAAVEESQIGHYAGAVTRLAAFVVDSALITGLFNLGAAGAIWMLNLLTPLDVSLSRTSAWWLIPLAVWAYIYYWACYALSGRTPGKALMGLRVVRGDGSDVDVLHAAIRVAVFPASFVFGIGLIGIVFGSRRRALHDVASDTAVVYDFDARAAHLRFLVRGSERTGRGAHASHGFTRTG